MTKSDSNVILLDLRGESVMVVSFDLQTFILRARVLKLYRQALRVAKRAPAPSNGELSFTNDKHYHIFTAARATT